MKSSPCIVLACCWLPAYSLRGEAPKPPVPAAPAPAIAPTNLKGWGDAINPARDAHFKLGEKELVIFVPGSERSHDLSAELGNVDAPRVLQTAKGDFVVEVKVDGLFSPGEESTQPGRTGYTGAGIVIMADERNYVRLERAALQTSGSGGPHPYINFEVRLDGQMVSIGSTGDHKAPTEAPVWLRLTRKAREFHASVKQEGEAWSDMPVKELPSAWPAALKAGVHAVSTSTQVFSPKFSDFKITPTPVP